jgi:hypothetical protein
MVVKGIQTKIDTMKCLMIETYTSLPQEMQLEIQRTANYHHPTTTRIT